jgi:hypothetical protein
MCLYDFLHVSVVVCIVHVSVIYTQGCIRNIYTLVYAEGIETGGDDGGWSLSLSLSLSLSQT